MVDGPPDVGPPHREHLLGEIGRGCGGGVQRLVELDEALGGRGGEQLRLVGEVPIRRRGADARAPGDLPQREPFRPLFLH